MTDQLWQSAMADIWAGAPELEGEVLVKTDGRLITSDYLAIYDELGYTARLNLETNAVEVNGKILGKHMQARIRCGLRDFGIMTEAKVNLSHAKDALALMAQKNSYRPKDGE